MTFTCMNELEIAGGAGEERRAAADLVLALDCVEEATAASSAPAGVGSGDADALVLRFESVDGIPEDEIQALAPQFPGLSFTLFYFSLDGEFYGYARADSCESADFDEDTRDIVGRRYEGDCIAYVRATYDLDRAAG